MFFNSLEISTNFFTHTKTRFFGAPTFFRVEFCPSIQALRWRWPRFYTKPGFQPSNSFLQNADDAAGDDDSVDAQKCVAASSAEGKRCVQRRRRRTHFERHIAHGSVRSAAQRMRSQLLLQATQNQQRTTTPPTPKMRQLTEADATADGQNS